MVIGNGLIGKAFSAYSNNDDVCIFASGVSNSKTQNSDQFQREIDLVKSNLDFNGLFVYFSTSSIDDPTLKDSKYIAHKLKIEALIKSQAPYFFIIRLPNVIGESENKNTLINFFKNSIITKTPFSLQKNARRYLIHIDKLFQIIDNTISNNNNFNIVANLVCSKSVSVIDIVSNLEKDLKLKGDYNLIEGGSSYEVKVNPIFLPYI